MMMKMSEVKKISIKDKTLLKWHDDMTVTYPKSTLSNSVITINQYIERFLKVKDE